MTITFLLNSAEEFHAIDKLAKALRNWKRYDNRRAIGLSDDYARRVGRVRVPTQVNAIRAIPIVTHSANRRAAGLSGNFERISTARSEVIAVTVAWSQRSAHQHTAARTRSDRIGFDVRVAGIDTNGDVRAP